MYVKVRKRLKFILFLNLSFILVLLYQNCSPMKSGSGASDGTSFSSSASEADILTQKAATVLATRCASCHDKTIKSGGVDVLDINEMLATGVVVPNEPSLSVLFTEIQSGAMPPTKALSQTEMQAIYNWIQSGFAKAPVVVTPTPPTTVPLAANYNSIYTNILQSKCLGCHNSTNVSGGVSFSTYSSTMNTVQKTLPNSSSLYTSTAVKKTMPKGGTALTAAETKAISDWITAGAANN